MHVFIIRHFLKEITHDYVCNYKYKLLSVYVCVSYIYTKGVMYLIFLLEFTFLNP